MFLSVVIVNWNGREHLAHCLRSLVPQRDEGIEIIVVDNGSTDGSIERVQSEFSFARVLAQHENLGFAEGCNRGIAAAKGEWIGLLNNDAVAEPEWAKALARAAREAPSECGMLQSLMVYRERPAIVNSTGIAISRTGGGGDRDEGRERAQCLEPAEIFCPTAGAAAYRRAMLDAVRLERGWLDPEHFLYYEDTDLGWRCRLAGWSAWYVPTAIVQHVWHGSTRRHPAAWLDRLAHTNRVRTLVKNASVELLARVAPARVLGATRLAWSARAPTSMASSALMPALRSAWRARAEVEALRRISRRELELRWFR